MIKTKDELVKALLISKYTAQYNIFGQQALNEYFKIWEKKESEPFEWLGLEMIDGKIKKLDHFVDELERIDNTALVLVKRKAAYFVTRNWLKETLRLVQEYCRKTQQEESLESQSWYQFAIIQVDAWSYSSSFEFKDEDKKNLPVEYNGIVIDESMDGSGFPIKLQTASELTEDIIKFAGSLK